MKFNRVNDDKLQVIISKEDLQKHNLKKWDFLPYNPMVQKLFQDILEEAYHECGFEVGYDTQLMIEAYPMTGESMVLTVTKVTSSSKGLLEMMGAEGAEEQLFGELFEDDEPIEIEAESIVCSFADLEDVISYCKLIMEEYSKDSVLYKYQEQYYLALDDLSYFDEKSYGLMTEYGEAENLAEAFLQEHAQVVIAEKAVDILARL